MKRQYCDRCGRVLDETGIPSWVAYYDERERDRVGHRYYSNYSRGSFRQDVCGSCLDEMKSMIHSKVATEPAGVQLYPCPAAHTTDTAPCTDCWLCRLKRHFRRK